MPVFSVLRIHLDPTVHLGPVSLAWHGIFVALGLGVGFVLARRLARRMGLDPEVVSTLVLIAATAGIVGSRVLYLAEHGQLDDPGEWLGTRGFSFYGALVASPLAVLAYLRSRGHSLLHVDALAWAFPLASAVGRVGDLLNGEHYGPPTDAPWGIRYTHPEALTPDPAVAYQPGGLFEVLLGLLVAIAMWLLRRRLTRPLAPLWAAIGLYSVGRLVMFGWRSDSPDAFLGLSTSQLISIALVAVAVAGLWLGRRAQPTSSPWSTGESTAARARAGGHP